MSKTKKMPCFCSNACIDGACPNVQCDTVDARFGGGIAEDMGLERTTCSKCGYHTGRCVDCTFKDTDYCGYATQIDTETWQTPSETEVWNIILAKIEDEHSKIVNNIRK